MSVEDGNFSFLFCAVLCCVLYSDLHCVFADSWLHGKPMSRYSRSAVVCPSVCPSVTFVDCDQTATDRVMISMQADRASTWLRQAPNSIEIGLAVFEQWRT